MNDSFVEQKNWIRPTSGLLSTSATIGVGRPLPSPATRWKMTMRAGMIVKTEAELLQFVGTGREFKIHDDKDLRVVVVFAA